MKNDGTRRTAPERQRYLRDQSSCGCAHELSGSAWVESDAIVLLAPAGLTIQPALVLTGRFYALLLMDVNAAALALWRQATVGSQMLTVVVVICTGVPAGRGQVTDTPECVDVAFDLSITTRIRYYTASEI